jgi:hypothetical protein
MAESMMELARDTAEVVERMARFAEAVNSATASVLREESALRALGGSMDAIDRATRGAVSAQQAFATSVELMQRGLDASAASVAALSGAGRNYATIYGGTAEQATQRFLEALEKGDAVTLARFGITLDRTASRARQAASAFEQMGRQAALPETAAESAERSSRMLGGLRDTLLSALDPFRAVKSEMQQESDRAAELARKTNEAAAATERFRQQQAEAATIVEGVNRSILAQGRAIQDLISRSKDGEAGDKTKDRGGEVKGRGGKRSGGGSGGEAALTMREARDFAEQMNDIGRSIDQLAGAHVQLDQVQARAGEALRDRLTRQLEMWRQEREALRENLRVKQEVAFAEQSLVARQVQEDRAVKEQQFEIERRRLASLELERQHAAELDRQHKMEAAFAYERRIASEDLAARTEQLKQSSVAASGVVVGAFNQMAGAFEQTIAAMLEGEAETEAAIKARVHATLVQIGARSAVEAVFQTAQGIGKLAGSWGADPSAYTHFASAAAFSAVAIATGVGAIATRDWKQAAGGAGALPAGASKFSGAANTPGMAGSGGGSDRVNVVVNYNGAVYATRQELNDTIHTAVRDAQRRRTGGRMN